MALTKCKECGGKVSTKAELCPACGAKRPNSTSVGTMAMGGFFALIVAGGIIKSNFADTAAATPAPPRSIQPVESQADRDAREEKRKKEVTATCTTGMPALLADARSLISANDPGMAASRLNLCNGISTDPTFLVAVKNADRQVVEKQAKFVRDEKARKKRAGVNVGMSKEDVLASLWGKPEKVNSTTTVRGTTEQWVYGGHNYLYFTGDTLTAIQN